MNQPDTHPSFNVAVSPDFYTDTPSMDSETAPTVFSDPDGGGTYFDALASASKIMVVDDEPFNIMVVCKHLKDVGYRSFVSTTDPTEAMALIRSESPDLVVMDVMMPKLNGLDLLLETRLDSTTRHTPVLILTASSDAETKLRALEAGATDFLAKPVDPSELVLRIRNALTVKAHQDSLAEFSRQLEDKVRQRTVEMEAARREAIHCLARAAEYRDQDTGLHVVRVGEYVGVIARRLGMSENWIELLRLAAQLHDVGKIGVSDSILLKPGRLEPDEYELMKRHCEFGQTIIQPIADKEWSVLKNHTSMGKNIMQLCSSPIMQTASVIAQTHHEKWDGSGYPFGLAGEQIPIEGRMTALADVFDALSTKRPYKEALPTEACFSLIQESRGTHFDPQVVDAFFASKEDILRVKTKYAD